MKTRQVALAMAVIALLQVIVIVNAEMYYEGQIPNINGKSVSFIDNLLSFFKGSVQTFTIVGQDNHADDYPKKYHNQIAYTNEAGGQSGYWKLNKGDKFTYLVSTTNGLCNGNSGLYDIYLITSSSLWGVKDSEFVDRVGYTCYNQLGCIIELYCMPYDYPPTDSACKSWKSTSSLSTKNAVDNYMPLYYANPTTNSFEKVLTYSYCTSGCSEPDITCWRKADGICQINKYDCSYPGYPNCPASWPFKGTTASNSGCSSSGGTTPGTDGCTNGGTPNCVGKCAGDSNDCGGECTVNDDPDCSGGSCTGGCSDGCKNGDETGVDCGGSCDACKEPNPGEDTLVQDVSVVSMSVPKGESVFDLVDSEETFSITLKNSGTEEKTVKIEYGFYTPSYAKDIAALYSVFPFFSVAKPQPVSSCVDTEPFVKAYYVTIPANQQKKYIFKMAPVNAYVTLKKGNYILDEVKLVPFIGALAHYGEGECCKKLPFNEEGKSTGCAEGTGGWLSGKSGYTYVTDYYHHGTAVSSWFQEGLITCGGEVYGKVYYYTLKADTIEILRDYKECIDYDKFWNLNGTVNKTATEDYEAKAKAGELISAKKLSLTKEEINKATTEDLLSSACLRNSECLTLNNNYTASCIPIAKLREDGILSAATQKSFFDKAKAVTSGTIWGATGGVVACTVLWGAAGAVVGGPAGAGLSIANVLANPATLGSCAAVGGLLGGTGTSVSIAISNDDELVKKLQASDANSVGICTAESSSSFDLGEILKSIGKAVKITGNKQTDGIIVLIGGFLLIMFLMSMMRGK